MELSGFDPLPPWLFATLAPLPIFLLLRRWGKKITPQDNRGADLAVDIMVMLSFLTIIAGLTASNIGGAINDAVIEIFGSFAAAPATISGIATLVLGYFYTKNEEMLTLVFFGFCAWAFTATNGTASNVMEWWLNNAVRAIWNGMMTIVSRL